MLEFRRATDAVALADFFAAICANEDDRFFHPHPFTSDEAQRLCRYDGRDLYLVAIDGPRVVAYGLLRGWDAGYEVPSLGIAVHPAERGSGIARAFMHFLHTCARRNGSPRVRLKVYPTNTSALTLYQSLGYCFNEKTADGQLIGVLELNRHYRLQAG